FVSAPGEAIQFQVPGSEAWQRLETGAGLVEGSRVRTGANLRCEFRTPDGSEVRLNSNTELVFQAARKLKLARGQMQAKVAPAKELFRVHLADDATVTALATELDLLRRPADAVLTVLEGTTEVEGNGSPRRI